MYQNHCIDRGHCRQKKGERDMSVVAADGKWLFATEVYSQTLGQIANCGEFPILEALDRIISIRRSLETNADTRVTAGDLIVAGPIVSIPYILKIFPLNYSVAYHIQTAVINRTYRLLLNEHGELPPSPTIVHAAFPRHHADLISFQQMVDGIGSQFPGDHNHSAIEFSSLVSEMICRGFLSSMLKEDFSTVHDEVYNALRRNPPPLLALQNIPIGRKLQNSMKTRCFHTVKEWAILRGKISGYNWFIGD
jgi:hypothetical protein